VYFYFLYNYFCETYFILKNIQRDIIINIRWFSCKVPLIFSDLELEYSREIFEKYSNIKFHENPSSGNRVVSCGQTDRTDSRTNIANNCFSTFCERVEYDRNSLS
jgi:hypothetical protein